MLCKSNSLNVHIHSLLSAQVGNKQNNRRRQNQGNGSGVRQQGGQSPIFYNDGNTQVGTQIGPNNAFNNQPGGKSQPCLNF